VPQPTTNSWASHNHWVCIFRLRRRGPPRLRVRGGCVGVPPYWGAHTTGALFSTAPTCGGGPCRRPAPRGARLERRRPVAPPRAAPRRGRRRPRRRWATARGGSLGMPRTWPRGWVGTRWCTARPRVSRTSISRCRALRFTVRRPTVVRFLLNASVVTPSNGGAYPFACVKSIQLCG